MNAPNPALVTQRAAARLPRIALLLFCAAYVLPGLFGRDPWKGADINAFGYMLNIARGDTPWLAPTVAGVPADAVLLPYWLGALFIKLLPWLEPSLAARIPFALLLALVLVLTWYAAYHLARSDSAQPLPFAFGGEAHPLDYARAIADGALLALIACLGLLQLGHETTPELAQLAAVSTCMYGLAASAFRSRRATLAVLVALPAFAASGAPSMALALGIAGTVLCRLSRDEPVRRFARWVALATLLAVLAGAAVGAWAWRAGVYGSAAQWFGLARQIAWFTWPAWPLALWTLWRWRAHWWSRHIAVPLSGVLVSLGACIAMRGSDRALMHGLPSLAILAAFALPTLQRSAAAAIDWFSVFFFSGVAITFWVVYASMQTGVPARPALNVARLAPGYPQHFSAVALLLAGAGTLAWLWLVRWRTGRHRHPLWKSMVLPASGVAVCWLLIMTLLLPPLDQARSYRGLVSRIAAQVPHGACITAPGAPVGVLVALQYFGGYQVEGTGTAAGSRCGFLVQMETRSPADAAPPGWKLLSRERRNNRDDEVALLYRRQRMAP